MGHMHMRIKGVQSTKEKPPDTDLEYNIKKCSIFHNCVT